MVDNGAGELISGLFWEVAIRTLAPEPLARVDRVSEMRPVVIAEQMSGLSNRMLAAASTLMLALVAGKLDVG